MGYKKSLVTSSNRAKLKAKTKKPKESKMDALEQLKEMAEAAKAQVEKFEGLKSAFEQLSAAPADSGLQDKIDALGKERDAKAKEADQLRAAIQAHIDDEKTDTAKLEEAMKPIEDVPVQAEVPKADDQAPAAADQPAQAPAAESTEAPVISPLPGA